MPSLIDVLLPLLAIWIVAVMTPGPNFFAVMHMAASRGRGPALKTVAGVVTATAIWAVAALLGLKTAFTLFPVAATAIKLLGGAYLAYTGWRMWRAAAGDHDGPVLPGSKHPYRFGLITTLSNPKTAAVAASLFAVAVPEGAPGFYYGAVLGAIVAPPALWYSLCALAGSRGAAVRAYHRAKKAILRVTGTLFVGFGLKLALER